MNQDIINQLNYEDISFVSNGDGNYHVWKDGYYDYPSLSIEDIELALENLFWDDRFDPNL
jgi:hypothetical protein